MAEKLTVLGARGASAMELARKTGNFGVVPTDSDFQALEKMADYLLTENPGFQSDIPGPADNTYTTLATFKASDIARKTASLVGVSGVSDGRFNWTAGNFTGQADDQNVIKADSTSLAVGAWVRQGADGINTKLPVSGAKARSQLSKNADFVSLTDFFAAPDADYQNAMTRAIASGVGAILIPTGVFDIVGVSAANIYLFGPGTLRKKAGTDGAMLSLMGDNRIEGITIDGNAPNLKAISSSGAQPYYNNIAVQQTQGSLDLVGVKFVRSAYAAVYVLGASLSTDAGCRFTQGKLHNGLSGGNEYPTHYIKAVADAATNDQAISIIGSTFIGDITPANLHLNPAGIFITAYHNDDNTVVRRFRAIKILAPLLDAVSTNAGNGNVTGAIDTYDGAYNVTIMGAIIRRATYAGIKAQNCSRFIIDNNAIFESAIPAGVVEARAYGIIATDQNRGSTIQDRDGSISKNIVTDVAHIGIVNFCDNVVILGNVLNGVSKTTAAGSTAGTGINSTGNDVTIDGNILDNIAGLGIAISGDRWTLGPSNNVRITGADNDPIVFFSGTNFSIAGKYTSLAASAGSALRTNGPASHFTIENFSATGTTVGVDIRTSMGAVSNAVVKLGNFNAVALPYNITSGVTLVAPEYLPHYPTTLASLPVGAIGGSRATVTDAATPTFAAAVTGGGATVIPAYRESNSGSWRAG